MICECGNHFFSCTRVIKYDVEISSISDAELESGISDEYLDKTIKYIAHISNGDIRYAYNLVEFVYYGFKKQALR